MGSATATLAGDPREPAFASLPAVAADSLRALAARVTVAPFAPLPFFAAPFAGDPFTPPAVRGLAGAALTIVGTTRPGRWPRPARTGARNCPV